MKYFRFAWRLTASCLHVLLATLLSPLLGSPDEKGFTPFQRGLITWLMRVQLRLLSVQIDIQGQPHSQAPLLVANHISWLDILVIGSVRTSRFLSKAEVKKWFLFGKLATHFGTLFIHRGDGVSQAHQTIINCLTHNTSTVIFPEGTTSDGTQVKKFYPRLFAAAIEAKTLVQPVALHYPLDNGVNPWVPFTRDQSILRHVMSLLHHNKHINVCVSFLEPVPATNMQRDRLAQKCNERIATELNRIKSL